MDHAKGVQMSLRFCAALAAILLLAGCQQGGKESSTTGTSTGTSTESTPAPAAPQESTAMSTTPAGPGGSADTITTSSGLKYVEVALGDGAVAEAGMNVSVHYTGWLTDGSKFDSSLDRGQPFSFPLGGGRVIRGWDEGVKGMRVGGTRKLIIPSELGYGERGSPPVIPPRATLIFEVKLLGLQ
jgi:FKBP-type peptidyl-prolyl cis-trans isomerase